VTGLVEIPITKLEPALLAQAAELQAAIARVLASSVFIGGPEVESFEAELARYLGVQACVAVNSGTDALVIGLRSLGVKPGDEVLVPAFGFIACAEAVSAIGATPVFVDVDARTLNVDPGELRLKITRRSKGLIAIHLYGQAAAMDELLEQCAALGLWLLEDAAQALGGRHLRGKLASLGQAAALSFFPTKNLGACGDGGMLATNDLALADVARALRQHGGRGKYRSELQGYNSRLDALQAAILRVRLPLLDHNVALRRLAADRYDALLADAGVEVPFRDPRAEHSFHQYTIRLHPEQRDEVQGYLAERGVQSVVHYPMPLHRQPVYHHLASAALPRAEAACGSVLSLPLWPEISEPEQRRVAATLRAALR
jgi:dTDP-4-amino-4,6-dideoxygalactose transaminase